LTVVTAISFCRVFADWGFLRPMLVVVIGTHVVAALLRLVRVPLLAFLPLLLFAILELLAVVYHRDSLGYGFPTSATIDALRADLRSVVDQFPTAVAPVPSTGPWAIGAAALLAICAAMADTFAFRAHARAETIGPAAVVFIFTAALGTEHYRVAVAVTWVAVALVVVAALQFRTASDDTAWMGGRRLKMVAAMPTILAAAAIAATAAGTVGPRLPGADAEPLYDSRGSGGSVTEILSPLVDIGSNLRDRGSRELFVVESDDGAHYWRLTGLNTFDGRSWELGDEQLQQLGDRSGESSYPVTVSRQTVTIAALGGNLVPAAFRPVWVSPDDVVWAPESQSLVLPDSELKADDQIAIDTEVVRPDGALLRELGNSQIDAALLQLPADVPAIVGTTAAEVASGTTTAYDAAIALQNWFRAEFAYDDTVDFSNDTEAMVAFLEARRGFCQQFAGTFAVMARSLGLPARVAVGFTPGDLGDDGKYHVSGRNAHAWPEVWFDDVGWVAFEPTPGRGNGDTTTYTGVAAQQDESAVPDGTVDTTVPATTPGTTPIDDTPTMRTEPDDTSPLLADPGASGGSGSSDSGLPLVLVIFVGLAALAVVWMVVTPRVVRAVVHRHDDTSTDKVASAWRHSLGVLALAGAPAVGGRTPIEYALAAHNATGVDRRTIAELARLLTASIYSSTTTDDTTVARCQVLAHQIDVQCRERIPAPTRARALFDPRLMRRRWTT
jgi:transglutaminase-like putative cysteine protease